MSPQRIIGIVLIVAGVGLFILGINATDSVSDRMSEFFTGHFTDKTVWLLVGGGAMAIGGLVMAGMGGHRAIAA